MISAEVSDDFLRKYATAATIALFTVVGVTGIMMFFDLGKGFVMTMHDWLGLLFVAASVLHTVLHKKSFFKSLGRKTTQTVLAAAVVASMGFLAVSIHDGGLGSPVRRFAMSISQAPLDKLAPALGMDTPALVKQLEGSGLSQVDAKQSLAQIARKQGIELPKLLSIVLHSREPGDGHPVH